MKDKDIEVCSCAVVHEDAVKIARDGMPGDRTIDNLSDFFKVFADPTRLRILNALFHRELCVCDLAAVLGMNQSTISHQLRILKQADLVRYRRDGKIVYYALDDDHVKTVYDQGLIHSTEKAGGDK
jgi:ArsR family transcriptional regulator, lead/cadmium/zinc/bismuth-responsive transcriptional repressor